jgi:hypothetical protein
MALRHGNATDGCSAAQSPTGVPAFAGCPDYRRGCRRSTSSCLGSSPSAGVYDAAGECSCGAGPFLSAGDVASCRCGCRPHRLCRRLAMVRRRCRRATRMGLRRLSANSYTGPADHRSKRGRLARRTRGRIFRADLLGSLLPQPALVVPAEILGEPSARLDSTPGTSIAAAAAARGCTSCSSSCGDALARASRTKRTAAGEPGARPTSAKWPVSQRKWTAREAGGWCRGFSVKRRKCTKSPCKTYRTGAATLVTPQLPLTTFSTIKGSGTLLATPQWQLSSE